MQTESENSSQPVPASSDRVGDLAVQIANSAPADAATLLLEEPDAGVASQLLAVSPAHAVDILGELPEDKRLAVHAAAPPEWSRQWLINEQYPKESIGRLMTPGFAEFPPAMTVGEAIVALKDIVKLGLVSYAFVIDAERHLIGVLVFRDMMLAPPQTRLEQVMIPNPFYLEASLPVLDAMRKVLDRHHPSYPICDDQQRLVGVVRGETLFRQQAFELSAQPGEMVGVEKEERLTTPWTRSLRFRHPWLQLNLLTAFAAASVVGLFEATIERVVVLAVFLPVLAGQSGNTGCQALAVTLRGMTLGELKTTGTRRLLAKEALLGCLNGALVGVTAGLGMLFYAGSRHIASAWTLAMVVAIAMTGACVASGVSGVVVPVTLRKLGADPATASSIFLTTATDCASMGLFLGLATLLVP